MTQLSERQQVRLLLQTTKPTTITALAPPSPHIYLSWSASRRRAWDRRYTTPNAYFFHYLHPAFTPAPKTWSLREHHTFLKALTEATPDNWGLFSLLLPGRVGSECRRYYHRIGRAGFINLDGSVRQSLTATANIFDANRVVKSANSLFRRRSLKKFMPHKLPHIDDTLYKSLEIPRNTPVSAGGNHKRRAGTGDKVSKTPKRFPENNSEKGSSSAVSLCAAEAQDLLTYVPPTPSEYEGQPLYHNNQRDSLPSTPVLQKSQAVYCRLRVRDEESSSRSNHSSEVNSRSRRTRTGSVKPRLRTKSKPDPSVKDSRNVKTRAKRREGGKSSVVRKLDKKTLKNEKEDKENVVPSQSQQSRGVVSRKPMKRAGRAKIFRESRKHGEATVGKQSGMVGVPPRLDCSLAGDEAIKLKKAGKPLRPILKSKDNAKKRRETTRTVHFSPTERQSMESGTRKVLVPNEDIIPGRESPDIAAAPQEEVPVGTHHLTIDIIDSDQCEIDPDPKIDKIDDLPRRTLGVRASENSPLAAFQSGTTRHATEQQVIAPTSTLVNSSLGNGPNGQLSGEEKVPAGNKSISSNVLPKHTQTPFSSEITIQSPLERAHVPQATELDVDLNSDKQGGSMPNTSQTTTEPFHVRSTSAQAQDSENHCFQDKSLKRVETILPDHSSSGAESQSTGTDGEFLDMEVEMATPPKEQTETLDETSEPASKPRNARRVTGPTRGDRTSISFLMNGEDAEPAQKKRRLGAGETSCDGDVYDRSECAASVINSDRDVASIQEEECEDSVDAKGSAFVQNDAISKVKSEYHRIKTRVEQTRLMLSLFIDMVDPIGEQLGHKHQRVKLLESFDESLQRIKFDEGQAAKKRPLRIPDFLQAAKTAFQLDTGNTVKHCTVHVGGLTRYWGAFVDSYIERVKDMEACQNLDVQSKRLSNSIF